MSSSTYTPRSDSLPGRVCAFFQRNRDEELTLEDIVKKFDVGRGSIHTNLGLCVANDLLKRIKNDDGDYIYKAGPQLPQDGVNIDTAHTGASSTAPMNSVFGAPKASASRRAAVELPDPLTVPIKDDAPVPGRGTRVPQRDWTVLLKRMEPGQHADLPIEATPTLSKAIGTAHKAQTMGTFTKRTFKEQNFVRVWRTA